MSKVFIVEGLDLEPFEGGTFLVKAFTSKEAAQNFIKDNSGVFDMGWYDFDTGEPCLEDDEDACYSYGWAYFSHVTELELVYD